jgi:hypothetical protein
MLVRQQDFVCGWGEMGRAYFFEGVEGAKKTQKNNDEKI